MRYSATYLKTGELVFECHEAIQMTEYLDDLLNKNLDLNDFGILDNSEKVFCYGLQWLKNLENYVTCYLT